MLNRLGQPSSSQLVRVSNALILQAKEGTYRKDNICGVYFSQNVDTQSSSTTKSSRIFKKHEDLQTGPYWTEEVDGDTVVYHEDPTKQSDGGASSKIRFVRRTQDQEFVVKKNVREGTWNLYEGVKKVLSCKQIQDHSFPLDGWNDDVKFSKGMSLRHAMGTSSMSVIRKMLEANSSPSVMTWLAKDKREAKEEEVSKLENIVKGMNEKDSTLYSISRLMYAVGVGLTAQDKPDKVLLQSLVAVKSSDKEEEKSLETLITAQNRRVENMSSSDRVFVRHEDTKTGPYVVFEREAREFQSYLSLNLSLPQICLFLSNFSLKSQLVSPIY